MSPAFVGRDDAFAAVTEALNNGPALVLIEGEAGIGKTRLVREALASVTNRTVLVAACPPLPEPFPLGPVVDGLRRLRPDVAKLGPSSHGVSNPHGLSKLCGALRPLFPEWADQLPPAPEPLDDPKETRHRALSALTEFVERVGVEILIVEDAHWADSATLEWLLTFTASGDLGLPIVVTYRPTDVPEGSLLRRLTSRLPAGMQHVRMELEPLNVDHARQLVGSMLGTVEVSDEFARFLHERTDGVPLALEETVRLMRDRRDIIRESGNWSRRVLAELEVPPTVRDSVLERVQRLGQGARAVLEAAAVLAAPAGEALLTAVAGLDADMSQAGLADALASGLLQETDPGRFVFRHVLDAQAVSEAIPVSRRRHLHAKAAEELRQCDPEPVVRLARHFREAGDTEAWCRYGEAVADLAWESGDDHTTLTLLLDLLGMTAAHQGDVRARLAKKLGNAAVVGTELLGELAARARQTLEEVLADGEMSQADQGETRLLLGRLLWQLGDIRSAYGETEAAIPDLASQPVLAARAMMMLAIPYVPAWPAVRHRDWLDRATPIIDTLDPGPDRLYFTVIRVSALLGLGEEAGWQALNEVPHGTSTEQEQVYLGVGMLNVAQWAIVWGRYQEATRRLAAADELVREAGHRRLGESVRVAEARLRWYTGAWDGLADAAAELLDTADARPVTLLEARLIGGALDVVRGGKESRVHSLREVQRDFVRRGLVEPEVALVAAVLGRVHLASGSVQEAFEATESIMVQIAEKRLWVWASDIAPVHVDALAATGGLDQAENLVEEFAAGLAGRHAPAPAASLATCRAILAEARGEYTEAAGSFAEAAAAWAALPRPYDELLALERQGLVLLAAGDVDNGLAVLTDTEQRLRQLGARWDADRVAQVLRRRGVEVVRTWRRGPKGYGDELSPRELQVVELVARGMTNRQVADTLFISHRTVGEHLSKAMRKLNVSSRAALVLAASNAGLLPIEMVES